MDTNVFIQLRQYPRDVFGSLWDALDRCIEEGVVTSVREVYNELDRSEGTVTEWAKTYKHIFTRPDLEEQRLVMDILLRFPGVLKRQNQLMGIPEADPFLVAKAKVHGHVVITLEKKKPNAPKIPNICEHYGVPCINLFDFFRELGWQF